MAAGGGLMGIAGAFFGQGKRVEVPAPKLVDFGALNTDIIAGNTRDAPAAEALASRTSMFNTETLKKMMAVMDPNNERNTGALSDALYAGILGQLFPDDVGRSVQKSTAKALGLGIGDSIIPGGAGRNLQARDLNLEAWQVQQQSISSMERWMGQIQSAVTPLQVSSSSMFRSFAQQAGLEENQMQFDWKTQMARAQEKAKPNPTDAALSGALGSMGSGIGGMALGLI
jgi:hypothetical protein